MTVKISILKESLEAVKDNESLFDMTIKYLNEEGVLAERRFCKMILILQSKYFFDSLVTFPDNKDNSPKDCIDLTSCPFSGKTMEILFDCFFVEMGNNVVLDLFSSGKVTQVYQAAKYFSVEHILSPLVDFLNDEFFDKVLDKSNSPSEAFDYFAKLGLYSILYDFEMIALRKLVFEYLQRHLVSDLSDPKVFSCFPARVLADTLRLGLICICSDEMKVFDLFLDYYEKSQREEKDILRPSMLHYFRVERIDFTKLKRLASSVQDFEYLCRKLHSCAKRQKLYTQDKTVFTKKLCFQDMMMMTNDNFEDSIEFEYKDYDFKGSLISYRSNPKFLAFSLQLNLIKMVDCIPEFTISLLKASDLTKIATKEFLVCEDRVAWAKKGRGKLLEWRSPIISKRQIEPEHEYILVVDMRGMVNIMDE